MVVFQPTSRPTDSPSANPVGSPSLSPATLKPTTSPSASPVTYKPTTIEPTVTIEESNSPSISPVTRSPSIPPVTLGVPTCILVTTGTGTFDGGYLDVLINTGSGYFEVNTGLPINYANNQVVLDACYEGFVGAQVTNPQTNAWAGTILSSVDNKASYSSMLCLDCSGTVDTTEYIVVDGDDNGIGDTECLNGISGNVCTLKNVATRQVSL